MDQKQTAGLGESYQALSRFCERYRADAEVRARIARGDHSDLGLEVPEGTEVRVVEQSADTYYFPLPPGPSATLSDEALEAVAGGRDYCFAGSSNPCHACACVT